MSLKVKVLGKTFDNPLLPASGPIVDNLNSLKYLNNSSIGGLVTKTISIDAAEVKKPCIVANDTLVHNTELWSEMALTKWVDEILPELKQELKKPLIIGAGYTSEDFRQSVPLLEPFADFFEVSTHYGKDGLKELVTTICSLTDKPVFVKLSPHITDHLEFVKIAVDSGASGVIAINSLGPGVSINLKRKAVTIGVNDGLSWVSGPAIKPIALHRVMTIRRAFPDLPIIACGGVATAEDVLEFVLAGADLVQMLSSALIKGRDLYDKIVSDLPKAMKKYDIQSMDQLRQLDLDVTPHGVGGFPKIDHDLCVQCGRCVMVCPAMAMSLDLRVDNDHYACIKCGVCESRCPVDAISGVL